MANLDNAVKPAVFWENPTAHRRQIVDYLNLVGDRAAGNLPKSGDEAMEGPLPLAQYTYSPDTRPGAATVAAGSLIYCTDVDLVFYSNGVDTWHALDLVGETPMSVVRKTTDQAVGVADTWERLNFDNVVQDVLALWDVANNSIVIPTWTTYVISQIMVSVSVEFDNQANQTHTAALAITRSTETPDTVVDPDEILPLGVAFMDTRNNAGVGAAALNVLDFSVVPGEEFYLWMRSTTASVSAIGSAISYLTISVEIGLP